MNAAPEYDSIMFINGPFGWHIPRWPARNSWVYLLHFNEPYKHARHYLGSTCNLDGRLLLHKHGTGARLTQVVREAGITWEVSRLWLCEDEASARALEHRLKRAHGHGPALCAICRGLPLDPYSALRQGKWPLALHDRHGRRKPRVDANYFF